jgi:dihydrofolate synthase/folylpolyglutamate synthase
MTYREAVARLLALRGGEVPGMRPGLERVQTALDAVGNPERGPRLAQVGGTNGKGSIAAMLAAMGTAAGLRTGLYTSPHLASFRERIRVDGRAIAPDDVVDGVEALGTLIARLDLTTFEATTVLALDHFARAGVELAVLEVGLGGRLDATTVGRPEATVLGPIDLDHQAWLGDTIEAIAREKAAIIRSGVALSARQHPEADRVVRARAAATGIPLLVEGEALEARLLRFALDGQWLELSGPGWRLAEVGCALLGPHQAGNALLAAATARELGLAEAAVRAGLARVRWPGRFQLWPGEPRIVLDAAHNPAGARALAAALRAYFPGQPISFVVGVLGDHDAAGILQALLPLAARLILTAPASPRAAAPEALRALVPPGPVRVELAGSAAEALSLATTRPETPIVCVAGSLYLVGEVLAMLAPGGSESPDILCVLAPG